MPYYAVARGKKVGVYETYNECFEQINKFPRAKFKKFDTIEGAEEFIKRYSDIDIPDQSHPLEPENANPSPSFSVMKVSPSNPILNNLWKSITNIEEKLNKFMSDMREMIDGLKMKIQILEGKRKLGSEETEPELQSHKKMKVECVDNFIEENGYVVVYTDGACSKNGKIGAKAGIGVWFGENHPLNVSAPVRGPPTNNNAEIQAARVAISKAAEADVRKLCVYTDSKFLISCITSWINKWKKNDWKLKDGGDVKNKVELLKLDNAIQCVEEVKWEYVPGHRGNLGNENADKLARAGAEMFKTNVTFAENVL